MSESSFLLLVSATFINDTLDLHMHYIILIHKFYKKLSVISSASAFYGTEQ